MHTDFACLHQHTCTPIGVVISSVFCFPGGGLFGGGSKKSAAKAAGGGGGGGGPPPDLLASIRVSDGRWALTHVVIHDPTARSLMLHGCVLLSVRRIKAQLVALPRRSA